MSPARLVIGTFVVAAALAAGILASSADSARTVPAPAVDETPAQTATQTAVLAGGCFWGVQGVFQHVDGVTSAVSGYAGGAKETAEYDKVGTGRTGHAEAVRITYDPRKVSYGRLLQIYFSVAHDPTQLNRQGPDVGPQYRSTIFPASEEQARIAKAYIDQLSQAGTFGGKIVTTIEPGRAFYPAEAYHQDFLTLHPNHPYIVIHDLPKVAALKVLFANAYRDKAVLVADTGM
jgi:peptide-methionine (S)-S-oxide reductase